MKRRQLVFAVSTVCLIAGVGFLFQSNAQVDSDAVFGRYNRDFLPEASGLVRSRKNAGVFWTHNDSGADPILYATTAGGRLLSEVRLLGAPSIDWEAVTSDKAGRLYVADFGNNGNHRKDLSIYVLQEPEVSAAGGIRRDSVSVTKTLTFHYPEQKEFPAKVRNFDAEAIFWGHSPHLGRGTLFLLTKNRSDSGTALYRFNSLDEKPSSQALTRVSQVKLKGDEKGRGLVTGAAIHEDGERIAVLTYYAIYIFKRSPKSDDYLGQHLWTVELGLNDMKQVEAISWVGDNLLVSNEQADIFLIETPLKKTLFP